MWNILRETHRIEKVSEREDYMWWNVSFFSRVFYFRHFKMLFPSFSCWERVYDVENDAQWRMKAWQVEEPSKNCRKQVGQIFVCGISILWRWREFYVTKELIYLRGKSQMGWKEIVNCFKLKVEYWFFLFSSHVIEVSISKLTKKRQRFNLPNGNFILNQYHVLLFNKSHYFIQVKEAFYGIIRKNYFKYKNRMNFKEFSEFLRSLTNFSHWDLKILPHGKFIVWNSWVS